jgi:hypothetical protein
VGADIIILAPVRGLHPQAQLALQAAMQLAPWARPPQVQGVDMDPVDMDPVDMDPVDMDPVDMDPADMDQVDTDQADMDQVDMGQVDMGQVDMGQVDMDFRWYRLINLHLGMMVFILRHHQWTRCLTQSSSMFHPRRALVPGRMIGAPTRRSHRVSCWTLASGP